MGESRSIRTHERSATGPPKVRREAWSDVIAARACKWKGESRRGRRPEYSYQRRSRYVSLEPRQCHSRRQRPPLRARAPQEAGSAMGVRSPPRGWLPIPAWAIVAARSHVGSSIVISITGICSQTTLRPARSLGLLVAANECSIRLTEGCVSVCRRAYSASTSRASAISTVTFIVSILPQTHTPIS